MVTKKGGNRKEGKMKWIFIVGKGEEGLPQVVGKIRVPTTHICDPNKGEYDKYTDGAKHRVMELTTKEMEFLRDYRHNQYMKAAKDLCVLE